MTESTNKKARVAHLKWVPIALLRVSDRAQREFRPSDAAKIAANFDLESLGYPLVNLRDGGQYFIIDGQHRIEAMKMIGWGDQQVQCDLLEGLSEAEEAELFLRRDERRAISAFDKFRIGITAERETETDIDRVVRAQGLKVSRSQGEGCVSAVGTLRKVYQQAGAATLGRSLRIIRDAYGDAGLEADVIAGIGLLCQRYNGALPDDLAVSKLGGMHGGVGGLLNKAFRLRERTGNQVAQCVAASAVDVINAGRGRNVKLAPWFKEDGLG